jgi:hypothetical protein
MNYMDPATNAPVTNANAGTASTGVAQADPAAQAAAAAAAAKAAQAAQIRGDIMGQIQQVKDIYNGRYGTADASAAQQTGNLNDRFKNESTDLTRQVGLQNDQTGAAFAGNGSFDSSYRGNAQDSITAAGNQQIDSLGQELRDNLAKVGAWDQQQHSQYDAGKSAMDTIAERIQNETEPTNLITLRNSIDNQIAQLKGQGADNNTQTQNMSALEQIAPSSTRAQQLKTTLSSILGGTADSGTKAAIGTKLIASAQLTPDEQAKLLQGFHTDLAAGAATVPQNQNQNQPA